jgi:hypothetical protein
MKLLVREMTNVNNNHLSLAPILTFTVNEEKFMDVVVPFSPVLPDITKCKILRAYRLGRYTAYIVSNPPTVDPRASALDMIEYIYAMCVTTTAPPYKPLLFITAEKTGKAFQEFMNPSDILKMINQSDILAKDNIFLCMFDGSGYHLNLGVVLNLDKLEIFTNQALVVARDKLQIQDHPVELHEINKKESKPEKDKDNSAIVKKSNQADEEALQ